MYEKFFITHEQTKIIFLNSKFECMNNKNNYKSRLTLFFLIVLVIYHSKIWIRLGFSYFESGFSIIITTDV